MGAFWNGIRDGSWLTQSRIRLIVWTILAVSAAAVLLVLATSDGLRDYKGRPLGTDYANVYAAGTYANEGRSGAPYHNDLQLRRQEELFGPATPLYSWHYPPFFLLAAQPFAHLPYTAAMAIWEIGTLLLYLLAIAGIVREHRPRAAPPRLATGWIVPALAYPAVLINLLHGNNAFLTTALLAGGLILLDRRPLVAGILIGLLCYKPQYGVLFPLVLAVSGRWRAFGAAGATVIVLTAVTLLLYPEAWRAFLDTAGEARQEILDTGGPGLHKMQSVFAWARMWGAPLPFAYALQGAFSIAIAAAVTWLWHGNAAYPLKTAALTLGAILATPYSLDYDLVIAAPAIAWLALYGSEKGFLPFEASALAFLWLVPLIVREFAQMTTLPLGVIALLIVFVLLLRRARTELPGKPAFALRQ